MKRNVFFFAALTFAASLYAVEPVDTAKAVMLQDVQVTSTRAGLTSSLKKHVFYNLLINNILYLCVT